MKAITYATRNPYTHPSAAAARTMPITGDKKATISQIRQTERNACALYASSPCASVTVSPDAAEKRGVVP